MAGNTGHRLISTGYRRLVPRCDKCLNAVEIYWDCSTRKHTLLLLEVKIQNSANALCKLIFLTVLSLSLSPSILFPPIFSSNFFLYTLLLQRLTTVDTLLNFNCITYQLVTIMKNLTQLLFASNKIFSSEQ